VKLADISYAFQVANIGKGKAAKSGLYGGGGEHVPNARCPVGQWWCK